MAAESTAEPDMISTTHGALFLAATAQTEAVKLFWPPGILM